jgi:hypothetical protein
LQQVSPEAKIQPGMEITEVVFSFAAETYSKIKPLGPADG